MIRSLTLALALAGSAAFSRAAGEAPALSAEKAAKIAADYLAQEKAGPGHIVSVVLESSAIVGGTRSWMVRWSAPLRVEGSNEVGLRVKMDGSVARVVENRTRAQKPPASAHDIR